MKDVPDVIQKVSSVGDGSFICLKSLVILSIL